MAKFLFPVDVAKAALLFASKDRTRYYLEGVNVEIRKDRIFFTATDGHRMIVATYHHALPHDYVGDKSFIVPTASLKQALAGVAKNQLEMAGTFDGQFVHLDDLRFRPIDGTFPNWRYILPKKISSELAQFDGGYIGDLAKAAKLLGVDKNFHIGHNGGDPAVITFGNRDDVFAVQMPRRVDLTPLSATAIAVIAQTELPPMSDAA